MTVRFYPEMEQGSEEWFAARCGLLTASEMKLIITPAKLQYASNEKERAHVYELAAQRITKYVEPHYVSDDMLRGKNDEVDARIMYDKKIAKLESVGFVTNDKWGFTLGYSPDALVVGGEGVIECKSRRQKFQIETILDGDMPADFAIQVQTGLLVSERKWCDFVTYSGGLPMFVKRIYPDDKVQAAIVAAAATFHERLDDAANKYQAWISAQGARLIPTERRIEQEIII